MGSLGTTFLAACPGPCRQPSQIGIILQQIAHAYRPAASKSRTCRDGGDRPSKIPHDRAEGLPRTVPPAGIPVFGVVFGSYRVCCWCRSTAGRRTDTNPLAEIEQYAGQQGFSRRAPRQPKPRSAAAAAIPSFGETNQTSRPSRLYLSSCPSRETLLTGEPLRWYPIEGDGNRQRDKSHDNRQDRHRPNRCRRMRKPTASCRTPKQTTALCDHRAARVGENRAGSYPPGRWRD